MKRLLFAKSVQYNDMRHCQSDVHLRVVTKQCADPANTDFLSLGSNITVTNAKYYGKRLYVLDRSEIINKQEAVYTHNVFAARFILLAPCHHHYLSWKNCTGFPFQNVLSIKSLVRVSVL